MKKTIVVLAIMTGLCLFMQAGTHTITSNTGSDNSSSFRNAFKNAGNTDIIEFNIDGKDTIKLTGVLSRTKKNTSITIKGINQATGNPIVLIAQSNNSLFRSGSSDASGVNVVFENMVFLNAYNSSHGGGFSLGHSSHTILGTFTFSNCVFKNCSTDARGGAIGVNKNIKLIVDGCTFEGNSSGTTGGAISSVSNASTVEIRNSTFFENTAGEAAGGIYINSENPSSIINCTLYGNEAKEGGAIYVTSDNQTSIINCTIVNNKTTATGEGNGAVYANAGGDEGPENSTELINCIVSGSMEKSTDEPPVEIAGNDVFGQHPVLTNCMVQTTDASVTPDRITNPIIYASSVFSSGTPVLADNEGPTMTIAISNSGGAYRSGITGENIPATDQRGMSRHTTPCIGAYEADETPLGLRSIETAPVIDVLDKQVCVSSPKAGMVTTYNLNGNILFEKYSHGIVTFDMPTGGVYIVKFVENERGNALSQKVIIK